MKRTPMRLRIECITAVGLRQHFDSIIKAPLPPRAPRHEKRHTLVLDIDETLVHTFSQSASAADERLMEYGMLVRPGLKEFLEECNELFEVVFWTAGVASYGYAVVSALEEKLLGLPPSMYNAKTLLNVFVECDENKSASPLVHFPCLPRDQTLANYNYMKYLPLLGRDMKSLLMIDDNPRSFPLTPRNGVKVHPFEIDPSLLDAYYIGTTQRKGDGALPPAFAEAQTALGKLSEDRALASLMPMLRAVAKADSVPKELDHWRPANYELCDVFEDTMNAKHPVRTGLLGRVQPKRQDVPQVPPFTGKMSNIRYIDNIKDTLAKRPIDDVVNRLANRKNLSNL